MSHANGAKSCIAHALDGGVEPDDFWYEQAAKVLGALTRYGFVVVKSAEAPTVIAGSTRMVRAAGSSHTTASTEEKPMSDRPYAAQARQMCPESDEHHDNVWFCLTCRGLETRLTPVTEFLADLLSEEEPVTIRVGGKP